MFQSEARKDNKKSGGSDRLWQCQCACGRIVYPLARDVATGNTTRCVWCARSLPRNKKSNYDSMKDESLITRWRDCHRHIIARCYNKKHPSFRNYGARGICVHLSLVPPISFCSFIMTLPGWDNLSLSLDRINNDGNYEQGNLRMATPSMQTANRRPKNLWGSIERRG